MKKKKLDLIHDQMIFFFTSLDFLSMRNDEKISKDELSYL